jgi:hypothetical protein
MGTHPPDWHDLVNSPRPAQGCADWDTNTLPGPANNPLWWDHPEADPIADLRTWMDTERNRPYRPTDPRAHLGGRAGPDRWCCAADPDLTMHVHDLL